MREPAGGGYSETLGAALPSPERERLNPSNCYDACLAAWGDFIGDGAVRVAQAASTTNGASARLPENAR